MKKSFSTLLAVGVCMVAQNAMAAWVDQHVQKFLDVLNAGTGKPIEQLSPKDARAVLVGAQTSEKNAVYNTVIEKKTIKVDGKPLDLTIVRPKNQKKLSPAFMFFHGGGWVLGDFKTHERLVQDIVVASGFPAIFVNYSPSPEAHYPIAINEAYAATQWVAEHGKDINVDGSRLAVVGNSVGGNMATVVSLMAKEKGTPTIKYQVLLWPVTDADFDNASYTKFADHYFLSRNMMKWFWDNYTKDTKERRAIFASPLQASKSQLEHLPPALVITAENDVLRDEGEAYAEKLNAAGVDVIAIRYNGMIHDFGLLNVISKVPATQNSIAVIASELKKHL